MSLKEKIYGEIGANYRFFLNWRHAGLVGHIFLTGATLSTVIKYSKTHTIIFWISPIILIVVSFLCLALDYRTRKIFQRAVEAGRKMEGEVGGYFTELQQEGVVPKIDTYRSKITHTNVITIYYVGTALISFIFLSFLVFLKFLSLII